MWNGGERRAREERAETHNSQFIALSGFSRIRLTDLIDERLGVAPPFFGVDRDAVSLQ